MSGYSRFWNELGIEPTDDLRAIRIAYAQRLKAIDVEADPHAFVALRQAFEAARDYAGSRAPDAGGLADDFVIDIPMPPDPAELGFGRVPIPRDPADTRSSGEPELGFPVDEPSPEAPSREARAPGGPELGFPTDDEDTSEPPAPPPPPPERAGPRPEPWRKRTVADYEENARALVRMLQRLGNPQSPRAEAAMKEQMLEHWRIVIADPRMQEVDFFDTAERWFADLIARAVPASDLLVQPAIDFFGWQASAGRVDQSPAVRFLLGRSELIAFRDTISRPGHRLNRAWKELIKPANDYTPRGRVPVWRIRELLRTIRTRFPDLEYELHWFRVALWERDPEEGGPGMFGGQLGKVRVVLPFVAGWAFLVLIMVATAFGDHSQPRDKGYPPLEITTTKGLAQHYDDVLNDRDSDIQRALDASGAVLQWSEIQDRNPKLAQLLASNWDIARDNQQDRRDFSNKIGRLLYDRYNAALQIASYSILSEYGRLSRDKAKALRDRDVNLCDDFLRGGSIPPGAIPHGFGVRERQLVGRTLLETRADPPRRRDGSTFSFRAAIAENAARQAHLPQARFDAALLGRGSPADRCNARIAMFDAALALPPKEGGELLRHL